MEMFIILAVVMVVVLGLVAMFCYKVMSTMVDISKRIDKLDRKSTNRGKKTSSKKKSEHLTKEQWIEKQGFSEEDRKAFGEHQKLIRELRTIAYNGTKKFFEDSNMGRVEHKVFMEEYNKRIQLVAEANHIDPKEFASKKKGRR